MSAKKDTDYLSVSSRIRFMETRLLTRERLERMIDATEDAQVLKVLAECGYGELPDTHPATLDAALRAAQTALYQELAALVPDVRILDVLRATYDYHNVKVLLKARRTNQNANRLLLSGGRYRPEQLAEDIDHGELKAYSEQFRCAIAEADDILKDTGDAQLADIALDRAYYAEVGQLAQQCKSEFLQGYVRLAIDAANLRICVRCARLEKDAAFLSSALLDGGNVPAREVVRTASKEIGAPFRSGALATAAELAAKLSRPGSGPLTAFERECDNALMSYLERCRRCPFGEEVVIGYLLARESELTAIRTIMAGRKAGLDADIIRQRLRVSYV